MVYVRPTFNLLIGLSGVIGLGICQLLSFCNRSAISSFLERCKSVQSISRG